MKGNMKMNINNVVEATRVDPSIHRENSKWVKKRDNWREQYSTISKEIRFAKCRAETILNEVELARYKEIRNEIRLLTFQNNRIRSTETTDMIRRLKRLLKGYKLNEFKPRSRREYMTVTALSNMANTMMYNRSDIRYYLKSTAHKWV